MSDNKGFGCLEGDWGRDNPHCLRLCIGGIQGFRVFFLYHSTVKPS